ncbi:Nsp1-like carboxy-terminal region protein [Gregarina niphandrodes]|uniref:Nsp1-like carboxy-terminal region protein n=1 Tax=Gregarina niphandrodes TaxID=110365 RepID=A0A023AY88_GRENI|nr:Nsp1-like carboxy-terminal region protein [Gregarina niphandrodes]EZG43621.1 Nsp1-like carboxy-terminal region protein [Gregarina niphandrodes]|eukprot:XP_011133149.1 Nsp1-like carboxy-terminal region protein [Gregarina niphandrodes]
MESKDYFEDVLTRWENQLRECVDEFDKYSRAMSELDCMLFSYVTKLQQCQQEQSEVEMKQQDIINDVLRVEAKQKSMMDVIVALQKRVEDIQPKESDEDPTIERKAREANSAIHELENCIIQLSEDLGKLENEIYPGELGELIHSVHVHSKLIDQLGPDTY